MFRNYLMVALRSINRQKMYSVLNISGLAVGLAAFILIMLYVQNELSFVHFLISALLAFVLAILTVSVLSVRAAAASPIKALRCDQ